MSTRALRKLHGQRGQDVTDLTAGHDEVQVAGDASVELSYDEEIESGNDDVLNNESVLHSRSKQTKKSKSTRSSNCVPANPFDLLNHDSDPDVKSNSDKNHGQSDENKESELSQGCSSKKKKKKKKKKRNNDGQANGVDKDEPEDEIDASIREVNQILGEMPLRGDLPDGSQHGGGSGFNYRSILNVEHRHLNPENEMRRIFGSNVVHADQARQPNRRQRNRQVRKNTWLVQAKNTWPHLSKSGLSMRLVETTPKGQMFVFEHSKDYQKVQFQFLTAVESVDAQNIINMLNTHPHHIDTLLQVSEICKMSEDVQMATDFIERALYTFECAFHPVFSLTQGSARLDYRQQENRAFYLALFRHLNFIGKRGCYRTTLEFCKLLLSLDPDGDPLCVLLLLDFYALRSGQYAFLIQLYNEWEAHRNLSQLPNFAFSVPLAMFHVAQEETSSVEKADDMLQTALIMFPGILLSLLDKCSVAPDAQVSSHSFFGVEAENSQPKALEQLLALYVGRTFSCWKEPDVLAWLERNVRQVLLRVDNTDPLVQDSASKRRSRYQGIPRNIHRHIIISEVKEATAALPPDLANMPVMSYDPLPPVNSTAAYTRPDRLRRTQQSSSPLSMFFQSLLPNFNPQEVPQDVPQGAVGGEGQGQNFRQGVMQVMDAMRDLLSNIRPVAPPVENEGNDQDGDQNIPDEEWD